MVQPFATPGPLVSCLCVTEGRPAFMPWLLWCFDRQTWPWRELVIVDSSPQPLASEGRPDVRVVVTASGGVAAKRNLALQAARGELIAWFDDDDWQHPERLARLAEALRGGTPYAGSRRGWFVDLTRRTCAAYQAPSQHIIFNSAGFRRAAVHAIRFPESVQRASDSRWMQQLAAARVGAPVTLEHEELFFWLCHEGNLSNPARSRRCVQPLDVLREHIGAVAWGNTDAALDALQARLRGVAAAPRPGAATRRLPAAPVAAPQAAPDVSQVIKATVLDAPYLETMVHHTERTPQAAPAVSLVIKATVLDAPYLEAMVRHMVAQARFSFAERVVVVDSPPHFSGKYQARPRASQATLDGVLARLQADGIIDRVQPVDPDPAMARAVLTRYFAETAPRIPTHASTGGPIYATLFGLEAVATDHVLQMDADVFFYSGAASWVGQALAQMAADPQLWLMMTHPGPPAGPPGASLAGPNARLANWDSARGLWRFRSATTRYFLCDRRVLHGRLRPLWLQGGHAPLEQCLSQALQRHGAARGCLGDLESWHLHAWYHGDPFPRWAAALAEAIAAGRHPTLQRGGYDLRLDRAPDRAAWAPLLAPPAPAPSPSAQPTVAPAPGAQAPTTAPALEPGAQAPIAVVIPVRNRSGARLRNALASLAWQTSGSPAQILLVSSGSSAETNRELAEICAAAGATLLTVGDPSQPWNKPFALNYGIRATRPELPFLMTMDADMILAPEFLVSVIAQLQPQPTLALCRSSDLPAQISLPEHPEQLLAAYPRLRAASSLRSRAGTGGIQAASRAFFFAIRGYDEDLTWWGAMDGDLVARARLMGLQIAWLEEQTSMLHQWHQRKADGLARRSEIDQARSAWRRNHDLARARAAVAERNPGAWGGQAD